MAAIGAIGRGLAIDARGTPKGEHHRQEEADEWATRGVGPGNDRVGVYGVRSRGFRSGPRIDVPDLRSESWMAGDVDDGRDEDIPVTTNTLDELAVLRNDGTGALAACLLIPISETRSELPLNARFSSPSAYVHGEGS